MKACEVLQKFTLNISHLFFKKMAIVNTDRLLILTCWSPTAEGVAVDATGFLLYPSEREKCDTSCLSIMHMSFSHYQWKWIKATHSANKNQRKGVQIRF